MAGFEHHRHPARTEKSQTQKKKKKDLQGEFMSLTGQHGAVGCRRSQTSPIRSVAQPPLLLFTPSHALSSHHYIATKVQSDCLIIHFAMPGAKCRWLICAAW